MKIAKCFVVILAVLTSAYFAPDEAEPISVSVDGSKVYVSPSP